MNFVNRTKTRANSKKASFLIIGLLFICFAFFALFNIRPPAAVRVYASSGVITFETPANAQISSRLTWPIENGIICTMAENNEFIPEKIESWDCSDDESFSGILWFSPGINVNLIVSNNSRIEIQFEAIDSKESTRQFNLRNLDGSLKSVSTPAKLILNLNKENSLETIVLPIVSQSLWVGRLINSQVLLNQPILQKGEISLVRDSFFGDILFESEKFDLLLGDTVQLRGSKSDYIQGVVQLGKSYFFEVALTVNNGEAWLHRLSRDPLHLDMPLIAQLFRDPTLIIISTITAFILSVWFSIQQIRQARQSKES